MMIIKHTIGNYKQEELMVKLAGVVEDYASETAGPNEYTDDIMIMGVARRSLRRILPKPLKDFHDVEDPLSNELLAQCLDDQVDYFHLVDHRDAIFETCFLIFNEWKRRIAMLPKEAAVQYK